MSYKNVFTAVSEALIPPGGGFSTGGGDVDLPGRLERIVRTFGRRVILLRLFFHFIDFLPILTLFSPKRFRSLSVEDRDKFLRRIQNSRWIGNRLIFTALKIIVMLLFYSSPEVEKNIGYETECVVEDK